MKLKGYVEVDANTVKKACDRDIEWATKMRADKIAEVLPPLVTYMNANPVRQAVSFFRRLFGRAPTPPKDEVTLENVIEKAIARWKGKWPYTPNEYDTVMHVQRAWDERIAWGKSLRATVENLTPRTPVLLKMDHARMLNLRAADQA